MEREPGPWPLLSRAERLAGVAALCGVALGVVGLGGIAILGPLRVLLALFACGAFLLAGSILGGLLVTRALPDIGGPLKTIALGALLVLFAYGIEAAGVAPYLRSAGTVFLAVGLGWGLWALGGLLAWCGAVCYAELGAMLPEAGAEYAYLREAYGPLFGFMSAFVSLVAGFSAPIAAALKALVRYLAALFPSLAPDMRVMGSLTLEEGTAIALAWLLVAVHSRTVRFAFRFNDLVTLLKVSGIVALIADGYGTLAWGFLAVYVLPLLTVGVYKLFFAENG